jgi:DNA-binding NarL/FixJ family response regulator
VQTADSKFRVIIVEDHALLRMGLKILLEQRNVEVVAEAENGLEAVAAAAATDPDVILMDLIMPVMDGVEAVRKIRETNRDVKIIMLTSNDNDEHIYASLGAGANGYCLKETKPDRLMTALHTVCQGDLWLDSSIAAKVLRGLPAKGPDSPTDTGGQEPGDSSQKLSREELEVLHLIVEGRNADEIGKKLRKSSSQIKSMEFTIIEKLAASDRTQSALKALQSGAEPDMVTQATGCGLCGREFNEAFQCCPFDGTTLESIWKDELTDTTFADRYEIISRVGNGGMSVVYKAKHKLLGRLVAIKLLDPLLTSDLINARRFREEALASSLLSHPNLINVIDFGLSENGEPYLIMDYLSGKSLSELIRQCGTVPVERALNIFIQVCDGLAHAHKQGVIHRDLKPSNIMLLHGESAETVKIIDFGIAKMLSNPKRQHLTQDNEVLGSPTYMSPEQCTSSPLDERSDIYSLGCTIYEALTGDVPLLGKTSLDTMTMHIEKEPAPMSLRKPSVPKGLDHIVMKALRKEPATRYQTMDEFKEELQRFVDSYKRKAGQEKVALAN